jgi:hypothetical protein
VRGNLSIDIVVADLMALLDALAIPGKAVPVGTAVAERSRSPARPVFRSGGRGHGHQSRRQASQRIAAPPH